MTSTAQMIASERHEVVFHRFQSDARDSAVEDVLYLVGGLELVEIGISSTRSFGPVDFIIATEYSTQDGVISVRYTLFRAEEPDVEIATEQFRASIDENFDHSVARTVRALVSRSGIDGAATRDAWIDGIVPEFRRDTTITELPREDLDPGAVGAQIDREPAVLTPAAAGFSFATTFGSAVWIGEISKLFRFAASGAVRIGVVNSGSTFDTEYGAKFAAFRLFPEDGVVGGDLYVATVGPRGGITTHRDHAATVGLHGSAGLAVITIFHGEGILAKSVPYAEIGAKGSVALSRNFSIGLELDFLSIFDTNSVIMGFPVAFTVAVRL